MMLMQPEAMLLAWWIRQKIKRFTVDAGMTALLRAVADALEKGEEITIRRMPGGEENDHAGG